MRDVGKSVMIPIFYLNSKATGLYYKCIAGKGEIIHSVETGAKNNTHIPEVS